jgi:glycosyltransferase involved in cell wall biosynthesis
MSNLVSIIVTSYNHAEYLRQRMESLLTQTCKEMEIIVVDDCSTDDSMKVLKEYEHYPQVKIVALDRNGGYANACNIGVKVSSGDFVMFAECDDYNDSDHVRILLEKLTEKETIGVAFCRSNIVDADGTLLRDDYECREDSFKALCKQETRILKEKMQRYFLRSCVIPNMSAALMKKKYFQMTGGLSSSYSVCADWDFWCRMAQLCDFYYVPAPLNYFRTHQSTVRNTFAMEVQLRDIFELLYQAAKRMNLSSQERIRFRVGVASVWAGYFSANRRTWIRSFFPVWRLSLQYDKLSVLFLFFSVTQRICQKLCP